MSDQNVVLITGSNSGLGRALAEHLAEQGDLVLGAMRDVKGRNASAAAELAANGIRPIELDVTSDQSVTEGVAAAMAVAGRIDVLINGAGIMPLGLAESFTVAQFEQTIQTNLIGPFRVMKAVLPHMRAAANGLLINVTSIGGRMASPGSGIYSATKWGLEALAESVGYEVSKLGIDSVILEPSLYLTELKAKGEAPTDTGNLAGYEALGDMSNKVSSTFRPLVAASGVSTDPRTLAEYVHDLIRMPAGTRPIRTTIGFDTGTAALNAATAPLQSRYMAMMGLSDMERVAPKG